MAKGLGSSALIQRFQTSTLVEVESPCSDPEVSHALPEDPPGEDPPGEGSRFHGREWYGRHGKRTGECG